MARENKIHNDNRASKQKQQVENEFTPLSYVSFTLDGEHRAVPQLFRVESSQGRIVHEKLPDALAHGELAAKV
jgi:hypothetical protein